MLCDVEVQDAPAIMADDEKAIEDTERDRGHREEIHCGNRFPVVSQKREPALGWLGIPRRPMHPPGGGSLGDIKTEHEKFAMDARRSPGRIFGNHPEDQVRTSFETLLLPVGIRTRESKRQ